MRFAGGGARVALLLVCLARPLVAQDSMPTIRHLLYLDLSRVHPFQRSYDMLTRIGDSLHFIGQRDLSFTEATYAGSPSWLLVETRNGAVPAAESLYLAPDLRPIHWSSTLGASRLGLEFVGDSILGATTSPVGRQNILLQSKPDVIVSVGMAEVLISALPLGQMSQDSVSVLRVDAMSAALQPAILKIERGDSDVSPSHWIVTLAVDSAQTLFAVVQASQEVFGINMSVPKHAGDMLVYRERQALSAPPLPP